MDFYWLQKWYVLKIGKRKIHSKDKNVKSILFLERSEQLCPENAFTGTDKRSDHKFAHAIEQQTATQPRWAL